MARAPSLTPGLAKEALRYFFDRDATIFDRKITLPFVSHSDAVRAIGAARRALGVYDGVPRVPEAAIKRAAREFEADAAELAAFRKGVKFAEDALTLRSVLVEPASATGPGVAPYPVNDGIGRP